MVHKLLTFKSMGDERGSLIAIEGESSIPFDIKRVFYVYNTTKGSPRGCHANRNSQFVLICVSGSCKIDVFNGSSSKETVALNTPDVGLYLDKMVWKEMYDFSNNAILLVMSSEKYDKFEYINDFNEYLKECNND